MAKIGAHVRFEGSEAAWEFLKFYEELAFKNREKIERDPVKGSWMVSWEYPLDKASGTVVIREKESTRDMVKDLKKKLNRNPFKRKFAKNIPEPTDVMYATPPNGDSHEVKCYNGLGTKVKVIGDHVYSSDGVFAGITERKLNVLRTMDNEYTAAGFKTEREDGVTLKIKLKDVKRKTLLNTYDEICRRIYEKSDGTYKGKVYSKDGKKSLDVSIPLFNVVRGRAVYGTGTGMSYRLVGDPSAIKGMHEQLEAKAKDLGGIYKVPFLKK